MAPRISVVVNTLNAAEHLAFALRSVAGWADEVIVVDMHSDDATVEIARSFGAEVYLHPRTGAVDGARPFALAQATGDWVMILDADEVMPRALTRRLSKIASEGTADVVEIPWKNFLLGAPLRGTGWGPHQDRHMRFFRRGSVEARETIHAYLKRSPRARVLRLPAGAGLEVLHFQYASVEEFVAKMNRYTTVEAAQAFERGERARPVRDLAVAIKEFSRRYLRRGGFRDGWRGLQLSLLMATYRVVAAAKLKEMEETGGAAEVRERYVAEAELVFEDGRSGLAR